MRGWAEGDRWINKRGRENVEVVRKREVSEREEEEERRADDGDAGCVDEEEKEEKQEEEEEEEEEGLLTLRLHADLAHTHIHTHGAGSRY